MYRTLVLALVLNCCATLASAAPTVDLRVGDCASGGGATSVTNACATNDDAQGAFTLVGSIRLDTPLAGFYVALATVDMWPTGGSVPDWWRLDAAGCRAGLGSQRMDHTVGVSCASVWDGSAADGDTPVRSIQWQYDPYLHSRIRLGLLATTARGYALAAGTELGVFSATIPAARSTGAGACAGCETAAFLVLSALDLYVTNVSEPVVHVVQQSAGVAYNGGQMPVAVRPRTWGAIKALYR